MLSEIEQMKLKNENLKLGEAIANFMNNKKIIGVFSVNEDNHLMKWTKSMFHLCEFNNCELFAPVFSKIQEKKNFEIYDGVLMLEIKFNQKNNHIKFRKTSLIEFGAKTFIPTIHVIYEVDLSQDDEDIYVDNRIDNGISEWKFLKMNK